MLYRRAISGATRSILERERAAGRERLTNLGLIEQGRRRPLEDWAAD